MKTFTVKCRVDSGTHKIAEMIRQGLVGIDPTHVYHYMMRKGMDIELRKLMADDFSNEAWQSLSDTMSCVLTNSYHKGLDGSDGPGAKASSAHAAMFPLYDCNGDAINHAAAAKVLSGVHGFVTHVKKAVQKTDRANIYRYLIGRGAVAIENELLEGARAGDQDGAWHDLFQRIVDYMNAEV